MAGQRGIFRCCSCYETFFKEGEYWWRSTKLVLMTLFFWCLFSMIIPSMVEFLNELKFLSFPLGFYMAAQGSLIGFVMLLFWYNKEQTKIENSAYIVNTEDFEGSVFLKNLNRIYSYYGGGFLVFVLFIAFLEAVNVEEKVLGYLFVIFTIMVYAAIGILSSSDKKSDFYVAGHQVPAVYNGMATAADWMSGASFVGMAGTLYAAGYNGLAFLVGWTGGYVLVATLVAPFLRKYKAYTVPDFLAARYGGVKICGIDSGIFARLIGILVLVCSSFTYLTAQAYSTGIIMSRFLDMELTPACYVGLAGILFCSMLGGMRGVTWTQVAQYIVLIVAYILPVVWMSIKTHNIIIPQADYGKVLNDVVNLEDQRQGECTDYNPSEWFPWDSALLTPDLNGADVNNANLLALEVKDMGDDKKEDYPDLMEISCVQWNVGETEPSSKFYDLSMNVGDNMVVIPDDLKPDDDGNPTVLFKCYGRWAKDTAKKYCLGDGLKRHTARPERLVDWWMLTFCLMLGTASLPHVLMRYFTTRSVRQARESVSWSLFFIFLLYFTAPALAVYAKYNIYQNVIGIELKDLPSWIFSYGKQKLVEICGVGVEDVQSAIKACVNSNTGYTTDGAGYTNRLRIKDIFIDKDVVVISSPEANGLPYVIAGLTAAGGLAASLSTADGLLLAISNSLSHDLTSNIIMPIYRFIRGIPEPKKKKLVTSADGNTDDITDAAQAEAEANAPIVIFGFTLPAMNRHLLLSRCLLVIIAFIAAWAASTRPTDILQMVAWAFSLAASGNFTALFLGVWWKRANAYGMIVGSLTGFTVCLSYIIGVRYGNMEPWYEVTTTSAGIFGIPITFVVTVIVTLLTPPPPQEIQDFVSHLRDPEGVKSTDPYLEADNAKDDAGNAGTSNSGEVDMTSLADTKI